MAQLYTEFKQNEAEASSLIAILNSRKLYEEVLTLLTLLPEQIRNGTTATLAKVLTLNNLHRPEEALIFLRQQDLARKLSTDELKEYLNLSVSLNSSSEELRLLLKRLGPSNASPATLIQLLERGVDRNDKLLLKAIIPNLSAQILGENPALNLAVQIVNGSSEQELNLLIQQHSLNTPYLLQLASLAIRLDMKLVARELVGKIKTVQFLVSQELYQLSLLQAELGLASQGIALILKDCPEPMAEVCKDRVELAWLVLQLANGNGSFASNWINSHSDITNEMLEQLYWIAWNNNNKTFANTLLLELFKRNPESESNQLMMVELYLQEREYKKALTLLKPLFIAGKPVEELYLSTLAKLVEHKEISRQELLQELNNIAGSQVDINRLRRLAKFGEEVGIPEIAIYFYRRVVAVAPLDRDALRALGLLYFDRDHFSPAMNLLGSFLVHYPNESFFAKHGGDYSSLKVTPEKESCKNAISDDYRPYLVYADTLQNLSLYEDAQCYYKIALLILQYSCAFTDEERIDEAMLLYRLGYTEEALCLLYQLLDQNPANLFIRATLIEICCDLGYWFEGFRLLLLVPVAPTCRSEHYPDGLLAIELARIRLYKETNQLKEAWLLAKHLEFLFPQEGSPLAMQGEIAGSIGWFCYSTQLFDHAICIDPENERWINSRNALFMDHASFLAARGTFKVTQNLITEVIGEVYGRCNLHKDYAVNYELFWDNFELIDPLQFQTDPDKLPPRPNQTRYRVSLQLVSDRDTSLHWGVGLYNGNDNWGGLAWGRRIDFQGFWATGFEYHQPMWDIPIFLVQRGSRDRLYITRRQKFFPNFDSILSFDLNRYNYPTISNVATTWQVELFAKALLPSWKWVQYLKGPEGEVSVQYYINGEYSIYIKKLKDLEGQTYEPFNFIDQEQHSLYLAVSHRFSPYLSIEGAFGYSYNRYSSLPPLPVGNIYARWSTYSWIELLAGYERYVGQQTGNDVVDKLFIECRGRF